MDFVISSGTIFDVYRLEVVLDLGKDNKIPLEYFSTVQNEDGGFAYGLSPGAPSSIAETLDILPWYDEMELSYTGSFKQAVNYLLDERQPKGYWRESEDVLHIMGCADDECREAMTLEITSRAAALLLYMDNKENLAGRAAKYLENFADDDGYLEKSPAASWLLLSIYAQLNNESKFKSLLERLYSIQAMDTDRIILALNCLKVQKGEKEKKTKLLDTLESLQSDDGSWHDGSGASVKTTVNAIRVLRTYHR